MSAVHVIEVGAKQGEPDPHGHSVRGQVRALTGQDPGETRVHQLYWLQGDAGTDELRKIASELLADPVVEAWVLDGELEAERLPEAIAFAPLPGVTDPAAAHVLMGIHDLGVLGIHAVITGSRVRFAKSLPDAMRRRIAEKLLFNPTIQREVEAQASPFVTLKPHAPRVDVIPITTLDADGLQQLSKERMLALSLPELLAIQEQYRALGREPRDAELETIAQTWSEHCVHKTLKGRYILPDRRYENLLKETIFDATQQLKKPWCVSVFADNAGVVSFVPGLDACMKVETHNHPSAIEPYGGAGTGVGGVIRDILGTGLGAMPIANTDVFCLANPDYAEELPEGVMAPERIMRGVVQGVRDYGNCMGIPTVNGALYFHPRYVTNPLVFCGTVGLIPSDKVAKEAQPGDLIALIGGGTGRDGIHGATFSSLTLDEESEMAAQGAVQIGNPIMERRVLDALIAARDAGLMTAVTDCGAGGLSSAVGEMGEKLGARVHLERVPLKYQGLTPWEIWVSEAQERMVCAVPPQHWEAFAAAMAREGVPCTAIGTFPGDGQLVVTFEDLLAADIPMAFLHRELPKREFHPVIVNRETDAVAAEPSDYAQALIELLRQPSIASQAWVVRQYDHEVQGMSAVKPLVGPGGEGPGDAAVLRPLPDRPEGLVVSCGLAPRYGPLNAYQMTLNAADEAVRNAVAVGADPSRIALLDNFAWGSVDTPADQGDLVQAAEACRDLALAYSAPFISGKDSLHNEFKTATRHYSIPPTMLISALGRIEDVAHAVTSDLKTPTNVLYQLGATQEVWGGSIYGELHGLAEGGRVPVVDLELNRQLYALLHQAIVDGLIQACHDCSEGGLLVALAEMALGGQRGVRADLSTLQREQQLSLHAACFAESPGRLIVEVRPEDRLALEARLAGLPCIAIGQVEIDPRFRLYAPSHGLVFEVPMADLREAYLSFSRAQGLQFAGDQQRGEA